MKNILFISLCVVFAGLSCKKVETKTAAPSCIEERISAFEKTACEKGAKVYEYDFQGERVYVFDRGYCDRNGSANVVSMDCKDLGILGGVSGNQDINGNDFSNAQRIGVLWSKK